MFKEKYLNIFVILFCIHLQDCAETTECIFRNIKTDLDKGVGPRILWFLCIWNHPCYLQDKLNMFWTTSLKYLRMVRLCLHFSSIQQCSFLFFLVWQTGEQVWCSLLHRAEMFSWPLNASHSVVLFNFFFTHAQWKSVERTLWLYTVQYSYSTDEVDEASQVTETAYLSIRMSGLPYINQSHLSSNLFILFFV